MEKEFMELALNRRIMPVAVQPSLPLMNYYSCIQPTEHFTGVLEW
jgi:hypothetical protein